MSSATDAQGPQIVPVPAMIDLSKLKPIGWYGRIGDNRIEKNLLTGVTTITPIKEEDDEE